MPSGNPYDYVAVKGNIQISIVKALDDVMTFIGLFLEESAATSGFLSKDPVLRSSILLAEQAVEK